MKKIVFALVIASLLLAGCSDKSKENTSDKEISAVSSSSETTDLSEIVSGENETPDKSENNKGDADAKSDSDHSQDKTNQEDSDNSIISGGELPVLTETYGETPAESESKITDSAEKNTASSSETETPTAVTENGGVIELPIIPVK